METLLPWIISLVSGGAGGAGAGALLKEKGLGMLGNLLTGAGGAALGNLGGLTGMLAGLLGSGAGGNVLGSGISGLVLTTIVGLIKNKMKG